MIMQFEKHLCTLFKISSDVMCVISYKGKVLQNFLFNIVLDMSYAVSLLQCYLQSKHYFCKHAS